MNKNYTIIRGNEHYSPSQDVCEDPHNGQENI